MADKMIVEEAKFLNLGTKKLFLAEKCEFSWLLMAVEVQLSQHVLQEGIFSDFSKIFLKTVIPCQKLVLDGDGVQC
jgi:hypothetical protein